MKLTTKILAMLSAVALLAACSTTPDKSGNGNGNGGANGGGQYGDGSSGFLDKNGTVPDRIFYETNSSVVDSEGQATLQKQATFLRSKPNLNATIEGHCDERGTREFNLALGERRANAAKSYLVSLGVDASRLQTISYGKERPAVTGDDESAWSQNRRAVTVTTGQ